jgi:hypothetical protein
MDEVTSNKNGRLRKDKFLYFCNKTQIVLQKKSLIFMSKNAGRICAAGMTGPCYVESIVMQTFAWNVCTAQRCRRVTSTLTRMCGIGWSFTVLAAIFTLFSMKTFQYELVALHHLIDYHVLLTYHILTFPYDVNIIRDRSLLIFCKWSNKSVASLNNLNERKYRFCA